MTAVAESPALAASIRAEMAVVGGMMSGPEMIPAAVEHVREDDFQADRYRRLYRTIVALWDAQEPIDEVTVVASLRKVGDLEAVGGLRAVVGLMNEVPSAANIEYHARIVAANGARRRLSERAEMVRALAQFGDRGADELQAEAERLIAEAAPRAPARGLSRVKDLLPETMQHLEDLTKRRDRPVGIVTGVQAVDDKLGPMTKGDLVLVAGRPSMGKSSFAVCNIAADTAIRQRTPVALFSVETNLLGVTKRLLGSEGRTNMAAARRNRAFRDDEYPRMMQASALLNTAPLWVDHTPGLTVDQMRVKLRRAIHETGSIGLVIVDYLQLMTHPRAKNRYEEVSMVGAALKRVATEFDTVLIAVSQLSRAVEQRPDKRPMMSDLRESGTLEQDADVILLLYRPEYYHGDTMKVGKGKDQREIDVRGKAEVVIAKVRDGETGAAVVGFDGEHTHFYDLNRP